MLHKSGINLESNAIQFIENNDTITLFSAYVKLNELKSINESKKINRIIVRWEIKDLCLGVSDIELYDYCLDNNITLYRNTRIHLKAFWNNTQDVFFGSANVTGRGLGEKGRFNYELNGSISDIGYEDVSYFNEIILNSEYVTGTLYAEIKNIVDQTELPTIDYPKLKTKRNKEDYFLLSNLPMTERVDELFEGYCNPENLNIDEITYVSHDIALYRIPKNLDESSFYNYLQEAFNSHPFIIKLKEYIQYSSKQSLRYGSVVRWIQENTTTVPTPRAWEIKQDIIVNILYNWICLLDCNYTWDVPGNKSQVIYYSKPKMKKKEAMIRVNDKIGKPILNSFNTIFSNINSRKSVWWINIPLEKFKSILYLLLIGESKLYVIKLPLAEIEQPDKIFKLRKDFVDIEIDAEKTGAFMKDIKAGSTLFDFSPYIILEIIL